MQDLWHRPGRREGAQLGGTNLGPCSLLLLPFHSLIRPHPLLPALCTSLRTPIFPWSPSFPCFSSRPFLWPGSSGRQLSSKQEYEPAPCRPEAGQCAATYRGQISPQSQTQLKEKAEGLEERDVGLARGSLSPSSAIRKSKPEKP